MNIYGYQSARSLVSRFTLPLIASAMISLPLVESVSAAESIKLGLIHPTTGRYAEQGFQLAEGALLAIDEINAKGGVLGRPLELLNENSGGDPKKAVRKVRKMAKEGASMLFGGATSTVAIAAGKEARANDRVFFGVLTYANETTGKEAQKYMFREPYNGWMTAKALSAYVNPLIEGKKVFYITADYGWGHSTEASIRKFTHTEDVSVHDHALVPFPKPERGDFEVALRKAERSGAEVLMVIQYAQDMATTLNLATTMGIKDKMQLVVPNLSLGGAHLAGAAAMEGVVGAIPWYWQVPNHYGFERGKQFVDAFVARYDHYPSSPAASSYTAVYEYIDAVRRAGSVNSAAVIKALENHSFTLVKDQQTWRDFDHQNVQSVYIVKGRKWADVMADKYRADYFEIIDSVPGDKVVRNRAEWNQARREAGLDMAME